jgi:hypothetical protein
MPLWPIQPLLRKVQNRRPVGFAPSRLARLERTVRRLECGKTKTRLPDGLVPSQAKVFWLAQEPDSPAGKARRGLLLLAWSSCEPLASDGTSPSGTGLLRPQSARPTGAYGPKAKTRQRETGSQTGLSRLKQRLTG